jgi:hypothetical protein
MLFLFQFIVLVLNEKMLCDAGALMGNGRDISKYTTAVTQWRIRKQICMHGNNWKQQQKIGVFCAVRAEML